MNLVEESKIEGGGMILECHNDRGGGGWRRNQGGLILECHNDGERGSRGWWEGGGLILKCHNIPSLTLFRDTLS